MDKYLLHPFTILQYYQTPAPLMSEYGQFRSNIDVPEELRTQFQLFGSLFEDPFEQYNQQAAAKQGSKFQ